uniref:Root phototropism protein 2 n=1 Tax=Anthurium amnicola TaxID=1678845 RepID=A0A1D1YD75_9ARAE
MTDRYCDGNLASRTEEFLSRAALNSLPSALAVLRSCERLLPMADQLNIVQRCVDAVGSKVCDESKFPTRSPDEWWAYELTALSPSTLQKVLAAMRSRGAAPKALATAVSAYAEKLLPDIISGRAPPPAAGPGGDEAARTRQRGLLESVVSLLPDDAPFHVSFLCCLLRAAVFLKSSSSCRGKLEKRVSAALNQASVGDLLSVTLDCGGERVADVETVRRIVAGFVEREGRGGVLYGGGAVCCSAAMQKVARTVDAFVGEIATDQDLGVSKFAGIAAVVPKSARRFDDDLYCAVDIYLKAHPELDEIEREKVCSVMDPLRLSYEARLHASQNKRLPLQIMLHALYYDQLNLRIGGGGAAKAPDPAADMRNQIMADSELIKENEALRSELVRMKMYVSDIHRSQGSSTCKGGGPKKPTFFSSVSKTLGKLNPFARPGSKDTSNLHDGVEVAKPRRRRFSLS